MFDLTKKEYNTFLLLNIINKYGAKSRTQLCEITGLRPATISNITKELLDSGIILEKGSTNSGRGRNQILLSMNYDYLCAIGINIEADEITFILATLHGNILKKVNKDITSLTSVKQITNLIIEVLESIIEELKDKKILGVGVGDPGLVDIKGEYSIFSSQLKVWGNIPLKSMLERELNLPVRLEVNDRLKALGQRKYGLAANCEDFICVQLGEGIGISIISGNTLIRGFNGAAGEMGHIRVNNGNSNVCICGSSDCLETYASLGTILSQAKDAVGRGVMSVLKKSGSDNSTVTFQDFKKAVEQKDKLCLNILENAANYIGIALSNVVNILDPKMIIFEGIMCELGNELFNPIISSVYRNSLSNISQNLEFKISELKDLSAPLGAITMVIDEFLMSGYFEKIITGQYFQHQRNLLI
ncbi:MAG: ROK family transcriptional regulator [Clostridiaceae bacterium]